MRKWEMRKWRNEEMKKWGNGNNFACRIMGNTIGRILTGKAGGLVFMVLVLWPARLFSWLTVGISKYDWEFQLSMAIDNTWYDWELQRWRDCHRTHGHQHLRVRSRGGEWLDVSTPGNTYLPLLALSTLSPWALWTGTGDCKSYESPH